MGFAGPVALAEHLGQHDLVDARLGRRRAALLGAEHAPVEVHELELVGLLVRLEPRRPPSAVAGRRDRVDARRLAQPRRRDGERPHRVGEVEPDRLLVLVHVEELDPRAVPAGAVREPRRPRERLSAGPGVASGDGRRQRLAHPLEHPVHHVDLVDQAAEEAARERHDRVVVVDAHGLLHLRRLVGPRLLDDVGGHVGAAREILRPEVGAELGVVHEHAHVSQAVDRPRQLRDQPLVRAVEPVVVADLDDAPGDALGLDDRVDVLERDGERLLDEHVEAGGERLEHDARVGRVGRPDHDAVEPRVGDGLRCGRDPARGCRTGRRPARAPSGSGRRRRRARSGRAGAPGGEGASPG